ncbi:glutathione S-transferase theta-2 [Menidia menidia]
METAQPLEVYLDLMSQPCRAVHILLACTGIPHRVRTVALRKGEQRAPAFTELNPMQKVPVLVDRGFVLTESDAILKYLATRYDVPDHWYPRQPERRARVDEYTAWHHTNTRPHAAKVFQLEVLLPASSGAPPDEQRLQAALRQLDATLDRLEAMFLRRQPFLCGHDVSLADLLALCELMQPLGGGRDVLKDRPLLCSWRGRVQAATGQAFHAAHAVLLAVAERRRARL